MFGLVVHGSSQPGAIRSFAVECGSEWTEVGRVRRHARGQAVSRSSRAIGSACGRSERRGWCPSLRPSRGRVIRRSRTAIATSLRAQCLRARCPVGGRGHRMSKRPRVASWKRRSRTRRGHPCRSLSGYQRRPLTALRERSAARARPVKDHTQRGRRPKRLSRSACHTFHEPLGRVRVVRVNDTVRPFTPARVVAGAELGHRVAYRPNAGTAPSDGPADGIRSLETWSWGTDHGCRATDAVAPAPMLRIGVVFVERPSIVELTTDHARGLSCSPLASAVP
jgi:hypothetical protein